MVENTRKETDFYAAELAQWKLGLVQLYKKATRKVDNNAGLLFQPWGIMDDFHYPIFAPYEILANHKYLVEENKPMGYGYVIQRMYNEDGQHEGVYLVVWRPFFWDRQDKS